MGADFIEGYKKLQESGDLFEHLLLDERDGKGRTLLMGAAYHNDKAVIEYLLENGRDVNAKDSDGWTTLMYAARVDFLMAGASVNEEDDDEHEDYEDDDDYNEEDDDDDED
ncbi:MAG: ankyrin repeat domain-containing protein [Acidobacteria bacterium]|nr:MAG: ankyrin repeat domain-containing protein [Acidobacteriota bacterium]